MEEIGSTVGTETSNTIVPSSGPRPSPHATANSPDGDSKSAEGQDSTKAENQDSTDVVEGELSSGTVSESLPTSVVEAPVAAISETVDPVSPSATSQQPTDPTVQAEESPPAAAVQPETNPRQNVPAEQVLPKPTSPPKSKIQLMKEERERKLQEAKKKREKEKLRKQKEKKKKKRKTANEKDGSAGDAELQSIRANISEEILYKRFSGYAYVCNRQGNVKYDMENGWKRRYIELQYREIRFYKKKNSTSGWVKSFFLAKGSKVKLMKARSEEFPFCFEILIGRTSKRFYIALRVFEHMESWLYALREFIPACMSIIRGLRVKMMGTDDEALQEYTPAQLKQLRNKIAKLFRLVKPKNSGEIEKDELLLCVETDPKVQMLLRSDPVLTLLLDVTRYSTDFMTMDTNGDGTISYEEILHFCGILRSRNLDRKNLTVRLFKLIDVDNNGDIDKDELQNAILNKPDVVLHMKNNGALRGLLAPKTYQKTFENMDTNNDGVISLEEMLAFVDRYDNSATRRRIAITRLFEVIDADNDGTLQQTEFLKAIKENSAAKLLVESEETLRPIIEQEDPSEIFKEIDKDGDGEVSLEELLMWCSVEDDAVQAETWRLMRVFVHLTEKEKPPPEISLITLASNNAPGYLISGKSLLKRLVLFPNKVCRDNVFRVERLRPLLQPSQHANVVTAMLGSWSSGKMNFEEFNAFCLGTILSQNFAEHTQLEEASPHHAKPAPTHKHSRTRDVLFKAHVDETKLEERKFEKDQKAINKERLKKARAEREAREAALAKAMKEEHLKREEEEKKLKAAVKLDLERKKKKKLHAAKHKAHDHMLVKVGAVGGSKPYCVGCRRIAWDYELKKAAIEEEELVKDTAGWAAQARNEEKEKQKGWKLLEEALQRREDKIKMKFNHDIEKQKRRFALRMKMGKQGAGDAEIGEAIRQSEPRIYTGKATMAKKQEEMDDSFEAINSTRGDGLGEHGFWERAQRSFDATISRKKSEHKKYWKKEVLEGRKNRFNEERIRLLSVRRDIEKKESGREAMAIKFAEKWDKEKRDEWIRRPPEDREMRKQCKNRETFLEIVSRLRTRGRVSRLLWQRTLSDNGAVSMHQVFDTARDKHYVMKVIPCSSENQVATIMDDTFLQRRVASECRYCVNVDDCFYHAVTGFGGGYYIVMILYECGTKGELAERVFDQSDPIDDELGLTWAGQIAQGLKKLHENQYIHRNLKPANVFISEDETAMIGDYPITKSFEATLPLAATYMGGPTYLAPELLKENLHFPGIISPPIDIWAFGCTIYYMCTGKEVCLTSEGFLPISMDKLMDSIPVRFETTIRQLIQITLVHNSEERATLDEIISIVQAEQNNRQNAREEELRHIQTVTDLFHRIDKDGGGEIEMHELLEAIETDRWVAKLLARNERLQPLLRPEKVMKTFAQIDKDGDGMVTKDELLNFTKILNFGGDHDKDVLNAVVKIFNILCHGAAMLASKDTLLHAFDMRPDVKLLLERVPSLQPLLDTKKYAKSFLKLETHTEGHVTLDEMIAYAVELEQETQRKREIKAQRKAEKRMAKKLARSYN
jgi:Ca2+-binding EF-hand superfamily protein